MMTRIWGMALLMLGLLVVAEGSFQILQKNTGFTRWLYIGLGLFLVVRGIMVSWPSRKKSSEDEA